MKAIVKTHKGIGNVKLLDVPDVSCVLPNDVLIKVEAAAICGSDLHAFQYPASYYFMDIPIILGHEFCGVVVEIGEQVSSFNIGDRVIGESNLYCGRCINCLSTMTNLCLNSKMRGLSVPGVMSEYVVYDEKQLHHVPGAVSSVEASLAQAITIPINGINTKLTVDLMDRVLVIGPGIVGFAAAQIIKNKGSRKVAILGTAEDKENRLSIASKEGIKTFSLDDPVLETNLEDYFEGRGITLVIECSGSSSGLKFGASKLGKGGKLLLLGIYDKPFTFSFTEIVRKGIDILTSYTSKAIDYNYALQYIKEGIVVVSSAIARYNLDEYEKAFQDGLKKKSLKPVIVFGEEGVND